MLNKNGDTDISNIQIQLFILPYAGGSIAAFKRLTVLIDDKIETITVEWSELI